MVAELKIKPILKSTKVLIVEDDSFMLTLIRDVLNVLGFGEIVVAEDGKKAFEEIKNNNYDLIFTDWKMPGYDGIEFARAIRQLPDYIKCCVPIIMVTGKATADDVRTARDAGINEYLVKPFSVKLMTEKIKSIVENPRKYILTDTYSGPDRRRRDQIEKIPEGKDRRGNINILYI